MASLGNQQALPRPPYSGTQASGTLRARLRRAYSPLTIVALLIVCALTNAGCALSYKLDSLLGKNAEHKDEVTGSFSRDSYAAAAPADLLESDLVYAKAVAIDLLTRGGKDASAPWANPTSGAHGTVTPTATAETRNGVLCRDFLASYLRANAQAWLQGEACRKPAGRWDVTSLKPLNRS